MAMLRTDLAPQGGGTNDLDAKGGHVWIWSGIAVVVVVVEVERFAILRGL